MKRVPRFSLGTGDRFAREGEAQLAAIARLARHGVDAAIVWNKSNREHLIVGSEPAGQRRAADAAVAALGWKGEYFVDADHVGLATVDRYIPHCDFFTIDVADFIGKPADPAEIDAFVARHADLAKPGAAPVPLGMDTIRATAKGYLRAVAEASAVYRRILQGRPAQDFAVEVSMDETDTPQSPAQIAVILAALADAGVPVQTIAPKFTGRFNKGVDYQGDVAVFLSEFEADARVAAWAPAALGLPDSLKLSVHSGSDKFSIYPGIGRIVRALGVGLHLKTAGTSWLEELVGLAEAGGSGLAIAKEVYRESFAHYEELTGPYASVIDIDRARLPDPAVVDGWTSGQYAAALRHVQSNPAYDRNLRQLLHVGYKVAAKMGARFTDALAEHRASVARNVTENLWERHFKPLFLADAAGNADASDRAGKA